MTSDILFCFEASAVHQTLPGLGRLCSIELDFLNLLHANGNRVSTPGQQFALTVYQPAACFATAFEGVDIFGFAFVNLSQSVNLWYISVMKCAMKIQTWNISPQLLTPCPSDTVTPCDPMWPHVTSGDPMRLLNPKPYKPFLQAGNVQTSELPQQPLPNTVDTYHMPFTLFTVDSFSLKAGFWKNETIDPTWAHQEPTEPTQRLFERLGNCCSPHSNSESQRKKEIEVSEISWCVGNYPSLWTVHNPRTVLWHCPNTRQRHSLVVLGHTHRHLYPLKYDLYCIYNIQLSTDI